MPAVDLDAPAMYATYIVKRTQIYLDEDQDERLAKRARAAGTTKSDLIREAVDAYLEAPADAKARLMAFREAVADAAGSVRRLPRGHDYVEALRKADSERDRALENRRRR